MRFFQRNGSATSSNGNSEGRSRTLKFLEELLTILKRDERFVTLEGQLLKPRVQDAVNQLDSQLIRLLMASPVLTRHFFKDVDGITIFDQEKFMWVVNSKEFLPDSYTSYRNKIGLAANDHDLLTSSNEVTLVWPYKDCVLEGGQDKEDEKRDEIFYNETLAPDEVNRLLAPKAFCNATRYTAEGKEHVTEFDENDNLLIKGNNLLVLSSLLERYEGQVKCIYIDPPYYFSAARAEDTFAYNSKFKKSTWLTFMENRLQIARRLLTPDGALFVQISDDGVAELHLLLKEVFGEENFLNKITVRTKSPSGFASVNAGVFETAEYVLAFGKDKRQWRYNTQYVATDWDNNYKYYVTNKSETHDDWTIVSIYDYLAEQNGFASAAKMRGQLGKAAVEEMAAEFALQHKDSVFRYTAISDKAGAQVVAARDASRQAGEHIIAIERENQYTVYVNNGQELAFYSKKVREIDNELVPSMQVTNIWSDTPYEGIAAEGGVTLKGGKKPEKLLQRIIALNTDPGDLVLDYHLGSGTTAAVAHKMGRRYIGIEQLDYGSNSPLARLREVIHGDKSGVSKSVGWKGGGSFVYVEITEQGERLMSELRNATTTDEVQRVLDRATERDLLRPSVLPDELATSASEFADLSLDDQKMIVAELIDKNRLYVNASEVEDADFGLSEADVAFTKSFYQKGE